MKELNEQQKKILEILHKRGVEKVEGMALIHWEEIRNLNDFKTVSQEADRYLKELDNGQL